MKHCFLFVLWTLAAFGCAAVKDVPSTKSASQLPSGVVLTTERLSQKEGTTYRLLTEVEWEYACRAGTTTSYSFGDDDSALSEHAWWEGNCRDAEYAHRVGQKKPNPWGLYDMHGNVWEWCADRWYPPDDPDWPASEPLWAFRGGSWLLGAERCQSAYSYGFYRSFRNADLGFRVAADLPQKQMNPAGANTRRDGR